MLKPLFVTLLLIAAIAMLLERDWDAAGLLALGAALVWGTGTMVWREDGDNDGGEGD